MKSIVVSNPRKIRKAIPEIEKKVKVKILSKGDYVSISGEEVNEFLVEKVIIAVDFGFEIDDALLLLKENFDLKFINIKEHTPRKNLTEVRARIIGKDGRAKRTIEELTGGAIVVQTGSIGIIVDNEHLSQAIQGVISLIQGAKHGNVFSYLEKQNANITKSHFKSQDLGLREGMEKFIDKNI